jgi:hypothetical protein
MSLLKTRPAIEVFVPRRIRAGARMQVDVRLTAPRAVPVEHVVARLTGDSGWTLQSGDVVSRRSRRVLDLVAAPVGRGELPAGVHLFPCIFDLPPGLPPTYRGVYASTAYALHVEVAVPAWPDAEARYDVVVHAEEPAAARLAHAAQPVLVSTRPEGPPPGEPHVELSLASALLVVGGTLRGALALRNVDAVSYAGATLRLRPRETPVGRHAPSATAPRHHTYEYPIALGPLVDGRPIPFAVAIPPDCPPTHDGALHTLTWTVELDVALRWRRDLTLALPVVVAPMPDEDLGAGRVGLDPLSAAAAGALEAAQRAPPSVGHERIAALWREVAAAAGLSFDGDAIVAAGAHAQLRLARQRTDRGALALVATYAFAETGLDLHLESHLDSGGRRRERLRARDPAQARRFLAPLRPLLDAAPAVRADDVRLHVEASHAGEDRAALAHTLHHALALGRLLDAQLAEVPPPEALEGSLGAWLELAASLGGTLRRGDLRVDAPLGGRSAAIATTFGLGGQPVGTRIDLRLDAPLTLPAFATVDAVPAGWPAEAAAEARALLALPERARFAVERDALSLALNVVVVTRERAERVRDALLALDRLARALRPAGGAYR